MGWWLVVALSLISFLAVVSLLIMLICNVIMLLINILPHQHHLHITLRCDPDPIRLLRRRLLTIIMLIILNHFITIAITVTKLQRYSRVWHVFILVTLNMNQISIMPNFLMVYLLLFMMMLPLLRYRIHLLNPPLVAIKWLLLLLRLIALIVVIIMVGELSLWRHISRWWHRMLKVKRDHIQRWGQTDFVLYALCVLVGLWDYFVAAVFIIRIVLIAMLHILWWHFHLSHFLPSSCYVQFSLSQEVDIKN